MGKDRIWWTTENLYTDNADVVVQIPQNQPNITSNLMYGFARDPSWRQTIGPTDLTGAKISALNPTIGVYRHTYLKPRTFTESKGSVAKLYKPITRIPKGNTSLLFFERPSKITVEEKLGIPKGDWDNFNLHYKSGGSFNYLNYMQ